MGELTDTVSCLPNSLSPSFLLKRKLRFCSLSYSSDDQVLWGRLSLEVAWAGGMGSDSPCQVVGLGIAGEVVLANEVEGKLIRRLILARLSFPHQGTMTGMSPLFPLRMTCLKLRQTPCFPKGNTKSIPANPGRSPDTFVCSVSPGAALELPWSWPSCYPSSPSSWACWCVQSPTTLPPPETFANGISE